MSSTSTAAKPNPQKRPAAGAITLLPDDAGGGGLRALGDGDDAAVEIKLKRRRTLSLPTQRCQSRC